MSGVENITNEDDRLPFSQPGPIFQLDNVRKLRAAWRRLAYRNTGFTVSRITQVDKRLQCDRNDLIRRRAEVVLHCILLVVGGALETAGVATERIDPLWLVGEGSELEW